MAKKLEPPTAREWFDRADDFFYSQVVLNVGTPSEEQAFHIGPIITLKAFATEAYVKCLITLEGGNPPPIHNLLKLFDKLSAESKEIIEDWWNKGSRPIMDGWLKNDPAYDHPKTLRRALDLSSDAFLEWRYANTKAAFRWVAMSFPLFVRWRIVDLTNWGYEEPHPLAGLNPEPQLVKRKGDSFDSAASDRVVLKYEAPTFEAGRARFRANRNNGASD